MRKSKGTGACVNDDEAAVQSAQERSPQLSTSAHVPQSHADVELSAYEQIRMDHIRRNHEFMMKLGLFTAKDALNDTGTKTAAVNKPSQKSRVVAPAMPAELRRRSPRIQKEQPCYTGELIDNFGDASVATQKRKYSALVREPEEHLDDEDGDRDEGEVDYDDMKNSVREAAMRHMEEVRRVLLPTAIPDETEATEDAWRLEAVRRWGPAVGQMMNEGEDRDWKEYVQSRLSHPPPVSPIDFLQEYYAADTWRLLVACILMSRVSSLDTKHKCISSFFALYPTPSDFLAETDWSRVKGAIHSLGLFDDRLKSLTALTTRFLHAAVFNVSPDAKSEHKIRGIGAFGYESYLVFCQDQGATIKLSDGGRPLAPFVAWRKHIAKDEKSSH
mmetsp:Transcript_23920/g.40687  ORF Transcript_23920/g.40687 Transcript_23920/m.40687 type:complete len:387 (-) Transcript_23920:299-1459(-)